MVAMATPMRQVFCGNRTMRNHEAISQVDGKQLQHEPAAGSQLITSSRIS